jgi:two-component system response regulator HydG
MNTKTKILIVDDDLDICKLLENFLSKKGYQVRTKQSGEAALAELKKEAYDLLITDYRIPDRNGLELLRSSKTLKPDLGVIVITGYSDIRNAVEVIKYGAYDYVTKPLYPEELLGTVKRALAARQEPEQEKPSETKKSEKGRTLSQRRDEEKYLIGKSRRSRDIYKNMKIVAPTEMSVLIEGETGAGKELVAREIHRMSNRSDKPFVAIDCGALPKDIAGSEFFGHEKGAFTGAVMARDGRFKLADGGTLFLDEIGNLSYEIQLKLLRVLQERKFTRIGGMKDIEVDVRILTATNEDLKQEVEQGTFREDLYYRLNEFRITLSPLRNRNEDLEEFVDLFLEKANAELGKDVKGVDPEVMDRFKKYTWPGNLRELKNVIKRSVLLTTGECVELNSLPNEIKSGLSHQPEAKVEEGLKGAAEAAERMKILDALKETGNNKSKAAELLNIDRKTLYNKLKSLEINA